MNDIEIAARYLAVWSDDHVRQYANVLETISGMAVDVITRTLVVQDGDTVTVPCPKEWNPGHLANFRDALTRLMVMRGFVDIHILPVPEAAPMVVIRGNVTQREGSERATSP